MTTYKNSFHRAGDKHSTPMITTEAKPKEYKGYLIFERIAGTCFDIVKDGVCIGMMAGLNGAKKRIDILLEVKVYVKQGVGNFFHGSPGIWGHARFKD